MLDWLDRNAETIFAVVSAIIILSLISLAFALTCNGRWFAAVSVVVPVAFGGDGVGSAAGAAAPWR